MHGFVKSFLTLLHLGINCSLVMYFTSFLQDLQMQLSGWILRDGSNCFRHCNSVSSFQALGWKYLDWLAFLHKRHGWHGLPGEHLMSPYHNLCQKYSWVWTTDSWLLHNLIQLLAYCYGHIIHNILFSEVDIWEHSQRYLLLLLVMVYTTFSLMENNS